MFDCCGWVQSQLVWLVFSEGTCFMCVFGFPEPNHESNDPDKWHPGGGGFFMVIMAI